MRLRLGAAEERAHAIGAGGLGTLGLEVEGWKPRAGAGGLEP